MKFAHLADLHLGSWREEKMRDLSTKAFLAAIDDCISRKVDFILFAGDLFNTSLPSLDTLKIVTKKLKELKDTGIPLYAIAGSHDFSPSGKTMLDVLENAGLLKNVCKGNVHPETKQLQLKFTEDKKTGAKITGLLGKKGLLDKIYYQNLSLENLEQEPGYKIFLFHTTLSELKPKHLEQLESQPLSFLPKNFNYYAGGHIHHPTKLEQKGYGTFIYPGALFPNNFSELERYGKGGYALICLDDQTRQQTIEFIPIEVIKSYSVAFDCQHKTPEVVLFEIANQFNNIEINTCLITIRLSGILERGKVSDLNFKELFEHLYSRGAYFIMKNTSQLVSKEFEEIKIISSDSEHAEEEIIKEHLQQIKLYDRETEFHLTKSLLQALNTSKREGETVNDFQERVKDEIQKLVNV
ncbi:MAG TPA: exonuclease SbcCD subunit D [Candidatus Nanoarchaeia archaeon]|nr:exonuclease SbcCD subunit D [Candidatus Nanoarchaeia archaeon]